METWFKKKSKKLSKNDPKNEPNNDPKNILKVPIFGPLRVVRIFGEFFQWFAFTDRKKDA